MIPHPWPAVVLALATYRLVRLIGWDDFPLAVKARSWATGARLVTTGSQNARMGVTNEEPQQAWVFDRPTLAHFLACPFCQGFWVSLAVYVWWVLEPTSCLYASAPFALSAVVGLVSKNLDP